MRGGDGVRARTHRVQRHSTTFNNTQSTTHSSRPLSWDSGDAADPPTPARRSACARSCWRLTGPGAWPCAVPSSCRRCGRIPPEDAPAAALVQRECLVCGMPYTRPGPAEEERSVQEALGQEVAPSMGMCSATACGTAILQHFSSQPRRAQESAGKGSASQCLPMRLRWPGGVMAPPGCLLKHSGWEGRGA